MIGFLNKSRSARRWSFGLLLLLLTGGGIAVYAQIEGNRSIAPIASGGDFEVTGISVDTSGDSSREAREAGWREAQRQGWRKLWAQTKGGAAPALSDSALDAIVSAIVVEREQLGPRRYVATLGVLFDRARAGQILGVRGTTLRSAPMLVVPVYWSGGSAQVFESRSPWQQAWARYRTADSAVDYVRPSGGGSDSVLVNAAQTGRRSRTWWRLILDQFGAADVVVPVAHIERQWPGGPIKGTFAARFGPDNRLIGRFTLRADNGDGLDAMLDEAIKRLDKLYQDALRAGQLTPDSSLIIEAPVEEPEEMLETEDTVEAPVESGLGAAAQANEQVISVQFDTPDAASVGAGERSLRAIPGVSVASTSSLALGGTSVMRVVFAGDIDALRGALQARGWQVQQGAGVLRISRPGQPATP
ncbi:MAG: heavy-metal-associated domain-containing protein [Blastomonas sp.]